ncbi:ABC transporter permease [Adhaeribacter radiodurans]|uniref:ABC transporter permease n=2 Tax=Adhaeribacter radiodurans TaxID=2745197 RepID=A0A7L7LFT3_9BACT|nr:ABC transporter permease [Adhaeribacter radiodurans]
MFLQRRQQHGSFKARLFYLWQMLLLLHPRLWRREATTTSPSYLSQLNHYPKPAFTTMFQNTFLVAWRKLRRHKSYTLINVLSLSLGMASVILIFTLVKYHLSFDTFHVHKDRIYRITTEFHEDKIRFNTGVPSPLGEAFRQDYPVAEKVARVAFLTKRVVAVSPQKKFEEDVAFAEPAFFDIIHLPLVPGTAPNVFQGRQTALITERLAKKYFGEQTAVGQTIRIDDSLVVSVAGVLQDLPRNTDFRSEIYVPFSHLNEHSPGLVEKDWWYSVNKQMQCFIRLKPGVSAAAVNDLVLSAISRTYYDEKMAQLFRFKLQPLADLHFNPDLGGYTEKKNLWAFAFIGFILIITTCVNFVNLATAQALGRAKEIGIRKILGSQPRTLFWQFIAETTLLTGFALLLASTLAYLILPFVNQLFELQLELNPGQDISLLLFLAVLMLVVIFLAGSYPGLILARFQPIVALKGKLSQKQIGGFSLRKGLVITQFAISQLLIMGTLVIAHQMRYARQADLGFDKEAIVLLPVPDVHKAKSHALGAQFSRVTGVEKVTFCYEAPTSEYSPTTGILFDSRPEAEKFSIVQKFGDQEYVPTFGLKIVAGRNLLPADTIREYLLNESAVRALGFTVNQSVLGKKAVINGHRGTVVGVVKDFHNKSFHAAIDPLCITTLSENYATYGIKVNLKSLATSLPQLQKAWDATYPTAIFTYRFLDEDIARAYQLDTMIQWLIQAFAGIAIFIGCLGLYGLVAFMATQKTKEIGVRKVLGASLGSILWLFYREFLRLLLLAFVVAAPLAWWLMHEWLSNFVYRVELGSRIFVLAILITGGIALITVGYQSLKAALTNPVQSLRSE